MKQICTEVSCEFFQSYEWCKAPSCPRKNATTTTDGFWYHGNGKLGGEFHPNKPDDKERYGEYVKVVRCKDCRYNYANMIPGGKGCQQNVYIEVDDNFFCANGERSWWKNE